MTDHRRGDAYRFAVVALSTMLMFIFTVFYVGHAIQANNRPFCAVVVAITEPRPVPPDRPDSNSKPITPTGEELVKYQKALEKYNTDTAAYNKKVSDKLRALSSKYHC